MNKGSGWRGNILALLFLSTLVLAVSASAAEQRPRILSFEPLVAIQERSPPEFVRLKRDENQQPIAMQVAVVRFTPRNSRLSLQYVDLITAVHIGEHDYYQIINTLFTHYDAVLYELVAPEGTRIPNGEREHKNIISSLQSWMRKLLGMSMQLEEVDYTAPNLVHADLSGDEFRQSMAKRNESVAGMIGKAWVAGMGKQYSTEALLSEARLIKGLLSGDRRLALKNFMAEQMVQGMNLGTAIEGKEGSTLVAERNKKTLKVLRRQIEAGKQKLAIFYGAAHMQDMSRRLMAEFELVPTQIAWIDAWKLN